MVATGGYGRGLLAPGSDIDLLFLLPYKQTAWGESVAEGILYCLWDMGLKVGHATRSVDECIRQAKADMTIRTALLEARYLLGDRALFDEFVAKFDKSIVKGSATQFVAAKLAEREERLRRAGQSRYLVEPNVKDGKGGLRDLHTLFWIAKYVYRVHEPDELIERGVFDREEYKIFRSAEDFLWAVRCHMHFVMKRAEERLSFDIQREIAVRLGYTAHPGMRDVERFMKHYFLVAKDVGDLTAILCAGLEEREAKPMPVLDRVMARFKPRPRRIVLESDDFVGRQQPHQHRGRRRVPARSGQSHSPVSPRAEAQSRLPSGGDARRETLAPADRPDAAREQGGERPVPGDPHLRGRRGGAAPHERGGRARPLRARVRAHRRDDAVQHVSPLHGGRAPAALHRHPRRHRGGGNDEFVLASELMKTIQKSHRNLLYVALFLHDIAKGRVEDHSIAGARIARRFCPRLGLSPAETDTVAWLVEQHLVMSSIAQSRDLSDRKTIENFAAVVQSLERMKLLLILTTADIRAVGPGVWNSWKAQLLRTLYYETEPVLTGGFSEVNRQKRVEMAQAELRHELKDWSADELDAYIGRHYPAYWLKVDLTAQGRRTRISSSPRRAPARRSRPASASTPRAASPS